MDKAYSRKELMEKLKLTHREHFRAAYIQKAIELGFVELTLPDKPKSGKQQYRLTEKGKKARKG